MYKLLLLFTFFFGVIVGYLLSSERSSGNVSQERELSRINTDSKDISTYDKAKPRNKRVFNKKEQRINSLLKERKVKEILSEVYALEATGPDNPSAYLDAINLYEEILTITPNNKKVLSSFSNTLVLTKDYEKAFSVLSKCTKLFPKDELCNGNLTNLFISQGKAKETFKYIQKCLKNTPHNRLCLFNQASLYASSGEYLKAIDVLTYIIESKKPSSISMDKGLIWGQIATYWSILNKETKSSKFYRLACDEGDTQSCEILRRDYEK